VRPHFSGKDAQREAEEVIATERLFDEAVGEKFPGGSFGWLWRTTADSTQPGAG
jgi:hypothetical protein